MSISSINHPPKPGQSARFSEPNAEQVEMRVLGLPALFQHWERMQGELNIEIKPWTVNNHPFAEGALAEIQTGLEDWIKTSKGKKLFLHPGLGAWSESAELQDLCQSLNIQWVGPSSRVLRSWTNSLRFLTEAEQLGINHLSQSFDPIASRRELDLFLGETSKFPFVLKSVRQIAGLGFRVFQDREELNRHFQVWLEQLRGALGESMVFPERYLEGARAYVVPFTRFFSGEIHFLPPIDQSLQVRDQAWVMSCPASIEAEIGPEVWAKLQSDTKKIADHSGYVGVGALEYLIDGNRSYLVRALPRLDPGFRLWEKRLSVSALALQWMTLFREGLGPDFKLIPDAEGADFGFGLMVRLSGEDPLRQLPQAGWIKEADFIGNQAPTPDSVAFESHFEWAFRGEPPFEVSSEVSPHFEDQWLAQWIGFGKTRKQVFERAHQEWSTLYVAGDLRTNAQFLFEVLGHPWVKEGMIHAGFLEEEFVPEWQLGEFDSRMVHQISRRALETDQYQVEPGVLTLKELELLSRDGHASEAATAAKRFRFERLNDEVALLTYGLRHLRLKKKGETPVLRSLVRGTVSALRFREGVEIPSYEPVLWLKSKSRMIPHFLPRGTRIIKWLVEPDQAVSVEEPLAMVEWRKNVPV